MKNITIIICTVILFLLSGICVYADEEYDEMPNSSVSVELTLDEDLEIPETGIAIDVIFGIGGIVSGGGNGVPYQFNGYRDAGNFWESTNWVTKNFQVRLQKAIYTVTFTPEQRTKTVTFTEKHITNNYRIGYRVTTEGYIGTGGIRSIGQYYIRTPYYDSETQKYYLPPSPPPMPLQISCFKAAVLSGKIAVPEHDKDVAYSLYIIGEKPDGVRELYDYTFANEGVIAAGETEKEYSVYVRPDFDYTAYLSFNDEFKIQSKIIHIAKDNAELNFLAEKASKISGTISLPEGYTDFDYPQTVRIVLEDCAEPYDCIDEEIIEFTPENNSFDFELYNISEAAVTIVFYEFENGINGLFAGGAYYDNEKCVPYAKDAAFLENKDYSGIVLNMIKCCYVNITILNESSHHDYEAVDLMLPDARGEEYFIVDFGYHEKDSETNTFSISVPEGYEEYLLAVLPYEDYRIKTYYTGNGFSQNISDAQPVNLSEGDKTISWYGYEPSLPLSIEVGEEYDEENEEYDFSLYIQSDSDFDVKNIKTYIIRYDENGVLQGIEEGSIDSIGETHEMEVSVDEADYDEAGKISMLFWRGNNSALCETVSLKDAEY